MKRNIFFSIVGLVVFMWLTACEKKYDTPDPQPEAVTAIIKYSVSEPADSHVIADIKVSYTDVNGKQVEETMNAASWNNTIGPVKLPFKANFKITRTLKANVALTKESYTLGENYNISYSASNGKVNSMSSQTTFSVPQKNVEAFFIEKNKVTAVILSLKSDGSEEK